jgi:hypothetical protein
LDFDGEEVPVIFGGEERFDGVQLEQAMTTTCSAGSFASYNDEEKWLELAGVSARRRSWRSMACTEGSGRW